MLVGFLDKLVKVSELWQGNLVFKPLTSRFVFFILRGKKTYFLFPINGEDR